MWIWYLEQLEQLEQLERYAPLGSLLLSEAIGEAARHLQDCGKARINKKNASVFK